MNVLSLFSGIGGLELGLERAGMTVVGQVEIDEYCRRVLAKHWPEVPKHDDVRTAVEWWIDTPCDLCRGIGYCGGAQGDCFCRRSLRRSWLGASRSFADGKMLRKPVDVICGGFPCQDISNAGRRVGIRGERSGLWSYMADTVRLLRPRYVVMENVSAILVRGLDVVAGDLAEIGYDVQWDCVPAAAVGAPHRRDRWWGIAYPNADRRGFEVDVQRNGRKVRSRQQTSQWDHADRLRSTLADSTLDGRRQGRPRGSAGDGEDGKAIGSEALADTDEIRRGRRTGITGPPGWGKPTNSGWWRTEPDVGRVAHGIPKRVDRLRALGNAVVPQVAEHVGQLLVEFDQARAA